MSTCCKEPHTPPKACRRCGLRALALTSPEDYTLSERNTAVQTATCSSNKNNAKCHQDYMINVYTGFSCEDNDDVILRDSSRFPPTDQSRTLHSCRLSGSDSQDTYLLNARQLQFEHTAIPTVAFNQTVDPTMPSIALKLNLRYCKNTNIHCSISDR